MPALQSTAIRFFRYDDRRRALHVTFRATGTYAFHEVPRRVYDAFMRAPSKGRFFNEEVRDRYGYAHSGRNWVGPPNSDKNS
jgi:lysyl-tRNA synthetase class 2